MGGSAFTSGPDALSTPRMPLPIYELVKSQCASRLLTDFIIVASPIDGPGKSDFGDVDILVAWPKDEALRDATVITDKEAVMKRVGAILGAVRLSHDSGCIMSAHYALPWPKEDDGISDEEKFVQIDVRVCQTFAEVQWMLFKHAHGDLVSKNACEK